MKWILISVASISLGALTARAEVIRSSMSPSALFHAETWLRYKQPVVSNIESDDWKRVVRVFTTRKETRPIVTRCQATLYTIDPLQGISHTNVDTTVKPIINYERICEYSTIRLGKELTKIFKVPQNLMDVDLMVVPSSQEYGSPAPQIVGLLSVAQTITTEQKECLDDAQQALRDALSSDLTKWLVKLGTRVSIHLDDNGEKVDENERQRSIGFQFTSQAELQMRIFRNADGKCLYPDKTETAQILTAMERWSHNPVGNGNDAFMFRHRL
jgi:hypothetical protein